MNNFLITNTDIKYLMIIEPKVYGESRRLGNTFLALEDNTEFLYKTTNVYYSEYRAGIIYNDSDIGCLL